MTKPRVVIAVPLASPFIYWRTVAAILEMERPVQSDLMVFQGALVDRARNRLVEQMLKHPMEATHLLFLDADIVPPADLLKKLLKDDQPIVSGLYRKRLPPYEPMAFTKDLQGRYRPVNLKRRKSGLERVDVVGAGCLLIRREVFEKIEPPWFASEWRDEGHLSEDFSFCEKARSLGLEIFVDRSASALHLEPIGIGTAPGGSVQFVPMG